MIKQLFIIFVVLFSSILGAFLGIILSVNALSFQKKTCSDFKKWTTAQQLYDTDPKKYAHLDRGGVPGVVCESLKLKTNK